VASNTAVVRRHNVISPLLKRSLSAWRFLLGDFRQGNAQAKEGANSFFITHPASSKLQIDWNWFHTLAEQKVSVKQLL
jgi:hypothetical protein